MLSKVAAYSSPWADATIQDGVASLKQELNMSYIATTSTSTTTTYPNIQQLAQISKFVGLCIVDGGCPCSPHAEALVEVSIHIRLPKLRAEIMLLQDSTDNNAHV